MDALSRLLNAIGQSLGRGLGQVGQSELEQRQRLEALEAQRKANISGQLLQTFTQLLNTQGIQEVDPEGIKAIQQAVTDLALGRVDSPNVRAAISVFPKVADSANKIGVYRELATRDLDALARLIVNTNPDEAQKLLRAVGLEGMREGLRARGEILVTADQLGLQLTREQIESLIANRQAVLAKLEPEINLLVAQGEYTKAQADALRQKLPLELTTLQLKAQLLGIDVAKGEKELARFDELLNLTMQKLAEEVNLTGEQVKYLREQIKTEVLRQGQIEAQTEATRADTELTKKQAELVAEQIKSEAQRRGIELTERGMATLKSIAEFVTKEGVTDPETIKVLLREYKNFYKPPDDFIDSLANIMAIRASEAKADEDIQRAGAIADLAGKAVTSALLASSPEDARMWARKLLKSADPETQELVGNMAAYLETINLGKDLAAIIEPYMKMLPPKPEDESRVLGQLYNSIPDKRLANGIVNTIKGQWALMRATQGLENELKEAGVDKEKALTALYKAQAALAPKEFGLEERKLAFEREQFNFEKWYKEQQVKLGWARLELDKLLAQAEAAGTSGDTIKALKDLVSTAKNLNDVAINRLAAALREAGYNDCANNLEKSGSPNWIGVVSGNTEKCNAAIQKMLSDRKNYGDVIRVVEDANIFGQMVVEAATRFLGGAPAGPSGGAQPSGTPASGGGKPSGAPSGATGPQPQGGGVTSPPPNAAAAFLGRARALKAFGVRAPTDPKTAGAMAVIYSLEGGSKSNPFQVMPGSGVKLKEPDGAEQKGTAGATPEGPDKGFSAVIAADPSRPMAMNIDSAPVFGLTWILPVMARNPRMTKDDVKKIKDEYVTHNDGLFERAEYFKDERRGVVDSAAVAASYMTGALLGAGIPVKYTRAFTALMRTVAESDLEELNTGLKTGKAPPAAESEKRFLERVKKKYGNRYKELGFDSFGELSGAALQLYRATRLSTIGQVAIGGWK